MNAMPAIARRGFLGAMSASGVALAAPATALPTVAIGRHKVTRLIAGYNPIGGYAHSVPKLSAIMRQWFTRDRVVDFLLNCERNGINTWQASIDPKAFEALRVARDAGSKIQWLCLMHDAEPAVWKEVAALHPLAVVHHGEHTDRHYRAGGQAKIADFIAKAHDHGVLAGISSHVPEHIARSEDAGWKHDLYMTCFYNIRRDPAAVKQALGDEPVDELYLAHDRDRMTAVARQVSRPCLGFKIFAAGRLCNNRAAIERAFRYAYANLKPRDAVIVGMFPMLTDEVSEDAAIAREVLGGNDGSSS
ncbi:MAG: hypothetical protein R2729_09600 [Bryobacteraceae bacterium]